MQSSSVSEIMKKAVTTQNGFFANANAAEGAKDRADRLRKERKEARHTLKQWYGMKQRTDLSAQEQQEIDLLQYRNFLDPERRHMAPKLIKGTAGDASTFVEFGYVSGTGRNKRKTTARSFADEWMADNPEFVELVERKMKKNVALNKKHRELIATRAKKDAARAKAKKSSKRGQKAFKKLNQF